MMIQMDMLGRNNNILKIEPFVRIFVQNLFVMIVIDDRRASWRLQLSALRATVFVSAPALSNPAMLPSDWYIFFPDECGEFIEQSLL
jgi:hypothetical protein